MVCFLAGLLARAAFARRPVQAIETSVLAYLPGYEYLKQEGASFLGAAQGKEQPVVLVRIGNSWRIGVQTEIISEKWAAIFVPNSPNPHAGSVFVVARSHVRSCATPLRMALHSLRRCGAAMGWAAEALGGADASS